MHVLVAGIQVMKNITMSVGIMVLLRMAMYKLQMQIICHVACIKACTANCSCSPADASKCCSTIFFAIICQTCQHLQ